jgi:hypothetical protein
MPNPDPFPSKHQVGPPRLVPVHPVKAASSIRGFSTPPTRSFGNSAGTNQLAFWYA